MKVLIFAVVVGMAVQGWRNFPADGPQSTDMAVLVSLLGMLAAFCLGRGTRRLGGAAAVAVASAEATAVASNQVNVAVVVPGHGAGDALAGRIPDPSRVGWIAGYDESVVDASMVVDGMSAEELAEAVGERDA